MVVLRMSRPWKHPDSDVYYFRKAVPDDLREEIGWEVKRSLKTKDPAEARRRHTEEADRVQQEWAELRRRKAAPLLDSLDPATIKRAGDAWVSSARLKAQREQLQLAAENRKRHDAPSISPYIAPAVLDPFADDIDPDELEDQALAEGRTAGELEGHAARRYRAREGHQRESLEGTEADL